MSTTFSAPNTPVHIDLLAMAELQAGCSHPLDNIYVQTITIGCLRCGKQLTVEEYGAVWDRDRPRGMEPSTGGFPLPKGFVGGQGMP